MSACEANVESDEDVDFAEALELCLDPDCIGTVLQRPLERKKREKREKKK